MKKAVSESAASCAVLTVWLTCLTTYLFAASRVDRVQEEEVCSKMHVTAGVARRKADIGDSLIFGRGRANRKIQLFAQLLVEGYVSKGFSVSDEGSLEHFHAFDVGGSRCA